MSAPRPLGRRKFHSKNGPDQATDANALVKAMSECWLLKFTRKTVGKKQKAQTSKH